MKKVSLIFVVFLIVLGFVAGSMRYHGLVLNYTESYPIGLYKTKPLPASVSVGSLVQFCLPKESEVAAIALERGYLLSGRCSNGIMPLVKRVVAKGGDDVRISDEGVRINDSALYPNSKPVRTDTNGRVVPLFSSSVIPSEHYFFLSEYNAQSFDSRYFGAVRRDDMQYLIEPYLILGEIKNGY